jgi:flagellar hook-associated protein 2
LFAAQDLDQNALDALADAINAFGGGFTASSFFDGNGYRLSVTSDSPGAANELLIDTSAAGFAVAEVSQPQDAVLQIGDSPLGGVVITSTDNTFEGVAAGLDVTIQQASPVSVDIEVTADNTGFVAAAHDFVDSFNSLRDTLDALTSFDAEALTTGLLFGRGEVIRVESDLSRLLSGRLSSSSTFQSFEAIGISLDDQGKLSLDQDELTEAYAANPNELERLFTAEGSGVVDQFHTVIDALAGEGNSVLSVRSDTITDKIEVNDERILSLQEFLDRERERTLLEFFQLEETISRLQTNFGVLESIQALQPLSITRNN